MACGGVAKDVGVKINDAAVIVVKLYINECILKQCVYVHASVYTC